jgi:melanoma-associated antigen p97
MNWGQGHRKETVAAALKGRICLGSTLTTTPSLGTQRLFNHEGSSFQMFSSEAYGQKNLLFKDSTSELVPIATQTYEAWLGHEYLHAMKGLLCDPNRKSPVPASASSGPA